MDQIKTGELIRSLRMKNKLTQKQLAEQINVSDKAVSKWETGKGCPDISLLTELAAVFQMDLQTILNGEIDQKESETGNMKKLKFYVCPDCGNVITSTSEANISCCGKKLPALEARKAEENEKLSIEDMHGEWYISSKHSMTKDHYISFVAYVNDSTAMIFKQYPEWNLHISAVL
jgi:transcriptional regulator with XRE-family HTH domain